MKDDEIRIAVAEAMGWEKVTPKKWTGYTDIWCPLYTTSDKIGTKKEYFGYVPNYPADLNACAEMEATLDHTDRYQFGKVLCSLLTIDTDGGMDVVDIYYACRAAARQRCEAFLRVKGLWKEGGV